MKALLTILALLAFASGAAGEEADVYGTADGEPFQGSPEHRDHFAHESPDVL